MGGVDGRGIIHAVAQESHHVILMTQCDNDPSLLVGIDTCEQIDMVDPRRKLRIGEVGYLRACHDGFCRETDSAGQMRDDGSVITGDDLDVDAQRRQAPDCVRGILFRWVGENAEADQGQP
jgi:hypothetical protein